MGERTGMDAQLIMLAAPGATAAKLGEILSVAGYSSIVECTSGVQALEAAKERMPAVLVTTNRLSDMTGAALIAQMGELTGAVLITPQEEKPESDLPDGVMVMHNPLNKDVFLQTVHVLVRMSMRMSRLRKEVNRLERVLAERKIIDRAKGHLMDKRRMSESDAHHLIQKLSMDSGKRLAEVAQEILEDKVAV